MSKNTSPRIAIVGAWSRVRPIVSDVAPTYTGVTIVEMGIENEEAIREYEPTMLARAKLAAEASAKALEMAMASVAPRRFQAQEGMVV